MAFAAISTGKPVESPSLLSQHVWASLAGTPDPTTPILVPPTQRRLRRLFAAEGGMKRRCIGHRPIPSFFSWLGELLRLVAFTIGVLAPDCMGELGYPQAQILKKNLLCNRRVKILTE